MIMRERYMQQIRDFMDKPVVKVLTGMRRSGKSALLELTQEELLSRGVSRQNIIFMNFESLRYESLKNYKALYEEITARVEQTEGRVYLLLDEIQEVTSWEQAVNSFRVDFDCDIYVTGNWPRYWQGVMSRSGSILWILRSTYCLPPPMKKSRSCRNRSSLQISYGLVVCRESIR